MLRSLLIAAVSGARSLTPLAAVSAAAYAQRLPKDNGAPAGLGHPLVAVGTGLLAVAELAGDKMKSAPDRIILPGMAARLATGAVAAASVAPRDQRWLAGTLGAATALVAAHITFRARMAALRRYGQTPSGLVEDALTVGSAWLLANNRRRT